MASKNGKIAVELVTRVVGKWKETYQWIPIFAAFTTIALAFSVGANNLPAPFSTSVGSGALTLLKASIMASAIYVPGAASASNSTVNALFSDFLKASQPTEGFLMWSMVVVLITATMWLALATYLELPVSSQQSIQGAMLGTVLVAKGFDCLPQWNKNSNHNFNGGLLWILLEWTFAPSIACLCACFLFAALKGSVLGHENAEKRILIFLPIDYGISAGLLCFFIMSQVVGNYLDVNRLTVIIAVAGSALIGALLSLVVVVPLSMKKFASTQNYRSSKENTSMKHQSVEHQETEGQSTGAKVDDDDVEDVLKDFMQRTVLDTVYEEEEKSWASQDVIHESEQVHHVSSSCSANNSAEQSTPLKQLLKSTPNWLVQTRNFQRMEKTTPIENVIKSIRDMAKSTFPLLIQSATEVAAIVNPYVAILDVFNHRSKYSGNMEDVGHLQVKWWFRGIGGLVAAMGFLLRGWRLTQCLGGKLTYMSNSRGWASQISTVAAMIIVARVKLPVSSVHAFVGSLVGVGIADDLRNVNWKLLGKILCGWIMTIIFCCGVAYLIFSAYIHTPAYAVP
ncbi:hypothetical protein DITRI_Ditri19aG0054100 [Diplodiscus trichospermus]